MFSHSPKSHFNPLDATERPPQIKIETALELHFFPMPQNRMPSKKETGIVKPMARMNPPMESMARILHAPLNPLVPQFPYPFRCFCADKINNGAIHPTFLPAKPVRHRILSKQWIGASKKKVQQCWLNNNYMQKDCGVHPHGIHLQVRNLKYLGLHDLHAQQEKVQRRHTAHTCTKEPNAEQSESSLGTPFLRQPPSTVLLVYSTVAYSKHIENWTSVPQATFSIYGYHLRIVFFFFFCIMGVHRWLFSGHELMSTPFVKFSLVQQQKCEVHKPSSIKRGKLLVTAPLLTPCPPEVQRKPGTGICSCLKGHAV